MYCILYRKYIKAFPSSATNICKWILLTPRLAAKRIDCSTVIPRQPIPFWSFKGNFDKKSTVTNYLKVLLIPAILSQCFMGTSHAIKPVEKPICLQSLLNLLNDVLEHCKTMEITLNAVDQMLIFRSSSISNQQNTLSKRKWCSSIALFTLWYQME